MAFAADIVRRGRKLGLRVTVDNDNESVGKKIRSAELWKVPYTLVIGEKEIAGGELSPRIRNDLAAAEPASGYAVDDFLQKVADEAKKRVNKTTL